MPESLQGTVERVTFHSEETGYAVLRVHPEKSRETLTLIGRAPAVTAGESFLARGEWVENGEYGRQFRATDLELSAPTSLRGIEKYLGSGLIDGIGPSFAKKVVEKFGSDVFEIIEQHSVRLKEVEGIGEKRRKQIRESWLAQKAVHGIMMFLFQAGLGTSRARKILKTYGDRAVDLIRANPYRLVEDVDGIGFATADDMARKLGLDPRAPSRIRAGLLQALETAKQAGNTAMERTDLLRQAGELLDAEPGLVESALDDLIREKTMAQTDISGRILVASLELREAEKVIAACLRALRGANMEIPVADWPELCATKAGVSLSPEQQKAVEMALRHRSLIITGGPGVGKTTVVRALLAVFEEAKRKVILAAPTGRAARRLAESSGREASTLHRLLEFDPDRGFTRWSGRPLDGDVFLVDEISMLDTQMAAHFLRALPPHARLILVGDADQLPSVGPGRVLADLIESETVPAVRLTTIFRQAAESRIIRAAHAVNRGESPEFSPERGLDFYFLERRPEETLETIVDVACRRIPMALNVDPASDVQILTPMNRRALGADELNKALQNALNPSRPELVEIPKGDGWFRLGDRVMQIRNDYEKEVFNGDIGRITGLEAQPLEVRVRFDGGRVARYSAMDLDDLTLAHAITIHKSQGSEFPAVVIPVVSAHHIMLRRNLIYTAITRGKRFVVMVGSAAALSAAAKRTDGDRRITTLQHWL